MNGCLRTCVCKQPIIALYFESETVLRFYNLEAWSSSLVCSFLDLTVATPLWFDIADLSDRGPVIVLQVLKIWLGQCPASFTGMEHRTLHERDVHMATLLV